MYRLLLAVAADRMILDAATNRLSIIQVYDDISATKFPAVVPRMHAVFAFERGPDDPRQAKGSLTFTLGDKELFRDDSIVLNFEDAPRARFLAELSGLVLPGPGTLVVKLELQDGPSAEWPILVVSTGKPEVEKASVPAPGSAPKP